MNTLPMTRCCWLWLCRKVTTSRHKISFCLGGRGGEMLRRPSLLRHPKPPQSGEVTSSRDLYPTRLKFQSLTHGLDGGSSLRVEGAAQSPAVAGILSPITPPFLPCPALPEFLQPGLGALLYSPQSLHLSQQSAQVFRTPSAVITSQGRYL